MKKIILGLLIAFTLNGCSKSSENPLTTNQSNSVTLDKSKFYFKWRSTDIGGVGTGSNNGLIKIYIFYNTGSYYISEHCLNAADPLQLCANISTYEIVGNDIIIKGYSPAFPLFLKYRVESIDSNTLNMTKYSSTNSAGVFVDIPVGSQLLERYIKAD